MNSIERRIRMLAACGLVGSLASAGLGQAVINVSGATLLENFLKAPAATNDYFDVDGNGVARLLGTGTQQLAPFGLPPGAPDQVWIVQYRGVGSVNGLQELIDFGQTFVTTPDGQQISSSVATAAYHNRTQYILNGVSANPIFNALNPGAAPVRSTMPAGFLQTPTATFTSPPTGGIRIDLAPVDVPGLWAVRNTTGAAAVAATPGAGGYGTNPRVTVNKDGTTNGFDHKLANLAGMNLNTGSPDDNTIFGTAVCFAPIAALTNLGTGMTQTTQTELRHGFATGRLPSGENLMFVTRDAGSGTRNGFNNSVGLDPSFGVGENVGGLSVASGENNLGPDFIPSGKSGSGGMEGTVRNHRLALGYSGAERGVQSSWLTGGQLELLAVRNDLSGGTEYSRPTINDLLDNNADGYVLGGTETFLTVGDPRSAPAAKGGDPGNTNPDMRNVEAAAFINNITLSVNAFSGAPGGSSTLFTPGELLATTLVLSSATDNVHSLTTPTTLQPNAQLNQALQDYTRANSVLANAAYATFGTATLNGKAPTRKTGVVYSDGVAGGSNYITVTGASVAYASNVTDRNRIAGDFNGDGKRDLNDASEMMKAYRMRSGGPSWAPPAGTGPIAGAPGSDAVIEIIGDFNGDGNFNQADVRYWADGLAIDPGTGKLDRKKGFEAVDNAWLAIAGSNNFFGTTGVSSYQAGMSRLDVSGPGTGHTRGFAPIGQDGVIDASDVQYIRDQFINNPFVTGDAEWASVGEAAHFDLSADVTGDLVVNAADVTAVLGVLCYPDCNGDGALNLADFGCFQTAFALGQPYADCNGDGVRNLSDFGCFQTKFALGCP